MASSFFKNFAIENGLTIDYGFMYGKYKGMFIALKETLGSSKTLYINTLVGNDKELTKKILSVFSSEELPKYCISDFKVNENYLSFNFELIGEKTNLIVEFIDILIQSMVDNGVGGKIYCPICKKEIGEDEEISIVDIGGVISITHASCYDTGKKKAEEKTDIKEKEEKSEGNNSSYLKGLLGAGVFSLIYIGILSLLFFFMQVVLDNVEEGDSFISILQYFPVLGGLAACPIIYTGYEAFNGKKGTSKYIIILWSVIISSILGSIIGFVVSFSVVTDYSIKDLFEIVGILIKGSYPSFRYGFYVYLFVTVGLSILSMIFKFSGNKENEAANDNTFEKLD